MEQARGNKVVKNRAKRKQNKNKPVYEELMASNRWNPFERVDPAILEAIHKRNQQNKITHILETTEDALW